MSELFSDSVPNLYALESKANISVVISIFVSFFISGAHGLGYYTDQWPVSMTPVTICLDDLVGGRQKYLPDPVSGAAAPGMDNKPMPQNVSGLP